MDGFVNDEAINSNWFIHTAIAHVRLADWIYNMGWAVEVVSLDQRLNGNTDLDSYEFHTFLSDKPKMKILYPILILT